jgi:nucleoid-associated protein YgaU
VAKGESLSLIAKFWYGDLMKYPLIFDANRDVLSSPDVVSPGQSLRIPLVNPKVEPPKIA